MDKWITKKYIEKAFTKNSTLPEGINQPEEDLVEKTFDKDLSMSQDQPDSKLLQSPTQCNLLLSLKGAEFFSLSQEN
ncbi:ARF GAP with effector function(s), variant 2 [Entomophthora muscae]|nr:ARF GAP with effector function(s), variant 2 [Entomophthora muscae]